MISIIIFTAIITTRGSKHRAENDIVYLQVVESTQETRPVASCSGFRGSQLKVFAYVDEKILAGDAFYA
jgi:hypothetical protein